MLQEPPLSHPEGMIKGHQHAHDILGTLRPFLGYPLLPSKSNTCLRMLLSHCQPLEKLLTAVKMLLKLLKTIPPCHFGLSQRISQTTCSIGIFMGILLFSHLNMCHVYIPFDYFPPENPELSSVSQQVIQWKFNGRKQLICQTPW